MRRELRKVAAIGSLALASLLFFGCGSSGGGGGGGGNQPVTIGPNGGTFDAGNGLTVTIPPGALSRNVQISAAGTSTAAPSGYGGLSNLYQFGPDGTTFAQPVTVTMPLPNGAPPNLTIYWSQSGNPSSYDDVQGTVSGSIISTKVNHFSTGFVAALTSMLGWVHRQDARWAYWVPNNNWIGSESMSGIEISSPTGDAIVEFAFVYGPLVPTTVDGVEALVRSLFSNFTVVSQSPITVGPLGGPRRITEFTGFWPPNQSNMQGIVTVDVGNQIIDSYVIMAKPAIWSTIKGTLQLIRDHITYFGP